MKVPVTVVEFSGAALESELPADPPSSPFHGCRTSRVNPASAATATTAMMASGRRDRCELGGVPCVCTGSLLTDTPQTGQNRAPGVTRWPEGQVGGVPPSNGNDMAFPRCFPNAPDSKNIRITMTGMAFSRCPVGSLVRRCSWHRPAAGESVLNRLSSNLVGVGLESGCAGQAPLYAGDSHSRPQDCLG